MSEAHPAVPSEFALALEALRSKRPQRHPRLREAERALQENQVEAANEILSQFLARRPSDTNALHLMGETALRRERKEDAETLLARCVELDPDFVAARYSYANALALLNKNEAALIQLDLLLKEDPGSLLYRNLKATVLAALGRHAEALCCHASLAQDFARSPEIRIAYGNALRSVGRTAECAATYREAIGLSPSFGEAYWSLAAVKSYRFGDAEIVDMQRLLGGGDLSARDRMYLHYALGRALGDIGEYEKSFQNYARANAIERLGIAYNSGDVANHVRACKTVFTAEFLGKRESSVRSETAPIFIVGMQRAGSTLIEQILASHSEIEATAELPNISLLAEHIGEKVAPEQSSRYPDILAKLDADKLMSFGESYLNTTRCHRKLGRPFFIDKMPYNFLHTGLIHLILPHAKIIDARRHPLDCCFSNFAMHFRSGPLFACRLSELGETYAKYVELMAHFDAVLPGRIHRVVYENLIHTPEAEIRRLLDYLGLPFEEACLEFHKSGRTMDSASAEQVRRPIYDEGVGRWRPYEPWLGPLKTALGPVLEAYPQVPHFPGNAGAKV